ncbi:hypothetical protein EST38_g2987 [Candolleomyces aberdarensis]|uniref:CRAL-TRIO domain-containing protein n=1 Tax=Candolleomyces aberdarensis TaxID=2316362 RepID=A0A4Q2DR39_9AGAR|nr:hypothetical protein EST38_g2987 [Candolleomyces aberdarensis]
MASNIHKKSASAPVSGTATPKGGKADSVFDPIEIETEPHFVGHLGHLTESQLEALKDFKDQLAKEGLYTPASEDGSTDASHDDTTLLRFLRARSFQPEAAVKQFQSAAAWRQKHDVDNLYASGFTVEEFEDSKRFYPRWTGSPVTPVSASTSIIDMGDASFSSMFRLRNHFQEASKLATANYPETLGTIVVVNSPSFFPTIWSWIKGWFDEGTRHKIHVLGKEPGSTLLNLVDAANLPKIYGGELDWTFTSDGPNLDDEIKAVLPGGEMPKGPAVFNLKTGTVEKP